jgi:hypothetical protein
MFGGVSAIVIVGKDKRHSAGVKPIFNHISKDRAPENHDPNCRFNCMNPGSSSHHRRRMAIDAESGETG